MMNTISAMYSFSSPDKLAKGLVVREGVVVFLRKDVVNVFHAPCLQQLGGAFGLTRECRFEKKKDQKGDYFVTIPLGDLPIASAEPEWGCYLAIVIIVLFILRFRLFAFAFGAGRASFLCYRATFLLIFGRAGAFLLLPPRGIITAITL